MYIYTAQLKDPCTALKLIESTRSSAKRFYTSVHGSYSDAVEYTNHI